MKNSNLLDNVSKPSRPNGLMILLVLTFINTGGAVIMGIISVLFLRPTEADMRASKIQMAKSISIFQDMGMDYLVKMFEKIQIMTEILNANFIASNVLNIGVAILGVISAFLMYNRKIIGFHGYIIYNILQVGALYIFVSPAYVPTVIVVTNLLISLLFILLYSKHLKYLRGNN